MVIGSILPTTAQTNVNKGYCANIEDIKLMPVVLIVEVDFNLKFYC